MLMAQGFLGGDEKLLWLYEPVSIIDASQFYTFLK
jgi:hypothetical protein